MSMGYVRFMILSEERTGSTFLQMLLNSHGQIICRGEILNPSDEVRRNSTPHYLPRLGVDDDAVEYLESNVFGPVPETVRAVGFRLMYSHAQDGRWRQARRHLMNDNEVRIIHLTREDLLARYLSHRLALENGRWILTEDASESPTDSIRLDLEDCVRSFTESEQNRAETDRLFSAHPKYDLTYETLTRDVDLEIQRVLEFLGVAPQQLSSPTRRQRSRSKAEVIENFEELKHFITRGEWSKPRWQRFFDVD